MWYVIQTKTGFEQDLVNDLKVLLDEKDYNALFVPLYEDVRRIDGVSVIRLRRLFPGYVIIDTNDPQAVIPTFRKVLEFSRFLGVYEDEDRETGKKDNLNASDHDNCESVGIDKDDGSGKSIFPMDAIDRKFLETILDDGIMGVSYIELMNKQDRIKRIVGPLAKYGNQISRLVYRKRYAVVKVHVFGKDHRMKFGLWSDEDPYLSRVEQMKQNKNGPEYLIKEADTGIHPGDKVRYKSDDQDSNLILTVESVNQQKRSFKAKAPLFGRMTDIELSVDVVEKVD